MRLDVSDIACGVSRGAASMFLAKARKKTEQSGALPLDKQTVTSGLMLFGYFGALRLVSWFVNRGSASIEA